MSELSFRLDPLPPWSSGVLGLPALAAVAVTLIALTLWTYRGHPQINRRRLAVVLALRLFALAAALATALRPAVGVQEEPKVPSVLLIGVDVSQSMTVPDELNGQTRIDAVRAALKASSAALDKLRDDQNVKVVLYRFGPSTFNEDEFDTETTPADATQSDYAAYLRKTFERWQGEPYLRANVVIGDGIDYGPSRPEVEAARWRQAGRQVQAFGVGSQSTDAGTKDLALVGINPVSGSADGSVYIKTDYTLRVVANANGFVDTKLPATVSYDAGDGKGYVPVLTQEVTFAKERENVVEFKLKAPDVPGEIKVKVEVPFASTPGDVVPENNAIETYLSVTKEGMRVLLVNRLNFEEAFIRRALKADSRIDLFEVIRQTSEPATAAEREGLDFDARAYDVIVIGDISAKQLTSIDPALPAQIRDQVLKRGVGLAFLGGHAAFRGTPGYPDATGWLGVKEIQEILPVDLASPFLGSDAAFSGTRGIQYLPTARQADHYLNRVGATTAESLALWGRLNDAANRGRFTGLSRMGTPVPTATVFAAASDSPQALPLPLKAGEEARLPPLLVGHQIGAGSRGRVLAFAAMDTLAWRSLGQPDSGVGLEVHARFWQHMVRWLAHQDEETGSVFARPELPRLPVGGRQSIRVGVRQPGGAPAVEPNLTVKVVAPGQDPATAPALPYLPDGEGVFKVTYEPKLPGEYAVSVTGMGKDVKGAAIGGEASARFFAFPVATDESLVKSARPEVMQRLAAAGGGQYHRLEELPKFLQSLADQPLETVKPRPKFYPDWRRDESRGFLPAWLTAVVAVLGLEWGLRRYWGLV
jgi:hypothetical protein